jgi:hypothetical protein
VLRHKYNSDVNHRREKNMNTTCNYVLGFTLAAASFSVHAVNNAPADVDTVTLRTSCTENSGATEIPNCFTSFAEVDNWLRTVRMAGPANPTLINIGPGTFEGWDCRSSNVTLKGSGRDRSVITTISGFGIQVSAGCTNLSVQDLTVDATVDPGGFIAAWGVTVTNLAAVTTWTNVEIKSKLYGWVESVPGSCTDTSGKHTFFSSRIVAIGAPGSNLVRAYIASCAQSWFYGSELTAVVNNNITHGFALEANGAEVHLYGSAARLLLESNTAASGYRATSPATGPAHYLVAALKGSVIHIHGTGLDVVHPGTGTADMLYADASSHIHANESGFNIHVSGAGKVQRLAGTGSIEAPYTWKQNTAPPLSTSTNGVQTLISRNGADSYIETDCLVSGSCSTGSNRTFPHQMIYRSECTGTSANQGPWFDMTTKACRQ